MQILSLKGYHNENCLPQNVKKIRNGNFLVKMDNQMQAGNILKMKSFHMTKYRSYPQKRLNTSRGVIWSRELAMATAEMTAALGKLGVPNIQRITIRKSGELIQTNIYILIFNLPYVPKKVKIGYCLKRVEQNVPASLRYFKCQKYWHCN